MRYLSGAELGATPMSPGVSPNELGGVSDMSWGMAALGVSAPQCFAILCPQRAGGGQLISIPQHPSLCSRR